MNSKLHEWTMEFMDKHFRIAVCLKGQLFWEEITSRVMKVCHKRRYRRPVSSSFGRLYFYSADNTKRLYTNWLAANWRERNMVNCLFIKLISVPSVCRHELWLSGWDLRKVKQRLKINFITYPTALLKEYKSKVSTKPWRSETRLWSSTAREALPVCESA